MTTDWWTLGFQTVNVAILIWLLGNFFWKPVAAMIVARKAATQKLTDEAGAAKTKADAALADIAFVEQWLGHRNDTSGLQAPTSRDYVVDTMEIAAP